LTATTCVEPSPRRMRSARTMATPPRPISNSGFRTGWVNVLAAMPECILHDKGSMSWAAE
jgi:hypothetical protein